MSQIASEIQKLDQGAFLALFSLDTTAVGGAVVYFIQGSQLTTPVTFGGNVYQPIDVQFDGLEVSGAGALPTPTLKLANTDGVVQALVNTYGDLNGSVLVRIRTYERFLDGKPDADSSAFFGPDIYKIERKVTDTPTEIVWELAAGPDQAGKMLPGRPMVRSTCLWRYRAYDGAQFNYEDALCPYTGSEYWNERDEVVTDPALDKPSRTRSCCKLRFGAGQPMPFGGFPGMGRNL